MPPNEWEEEENGDESSDSASPVGGAVPIRRKFEDEEDGDDVLDSWDAAEDSEVEREKAKKAEEAKAKALEEAKKNKKSKAERILILKEERARLEAEDSDDDETEAEKRERLRRTEKEADLKHAEDLFGDVGVPAGRKANLAGTAVQIDPNDPTKTANIADMPLFNPTTKTQFEHLRITLTPILANNSRKAHYGLFLQDFTKTLAKDLPSDQIKKIVSILTALGNEKMKEEKTAQGGNKKSKAAKTKVSAVVSRAPVADTETYENDDYGDDDFM